MLRMKYATSLMGLLSFTLCCGALFFVNSISLPVNRNTMQRGLGWPLPFYIIDYQQKSLNIQYAFWNYSNLLCDCFVALSLSVGAMAIVNRIMSLNGDGKDDVKVKRRILSRAFGFATLTSIALAIASYYLFFVLNFISSSIVDFNRLITIPIVIIWFFAIGLAYLRLREHTPRGLIGG
jgi:hypothetical protein